jgi:hypothetical protein
VNKKAFDKKGYWWLPSEPERKYPGRLTFNKAEGARLELTMSGAPRGIWEEPGNYKYIHGDIGVPVSLVDCFDLNSSWSSPGITTKVILVNFILQGLLVTSDDHTLFKSMWAHLPALETWLGLTGLEVKHIEDKFSDFNITYRQPPDITLEIHPSLKISIRIGPSVLPSGGYPGAKIEFEERTWLSINATPSLPYRRLLDLILCIQEFFSFASLDYFEAEGWGARGISESDNDDRYIAEIFFPTAYSRRKERPPAPHMFLIRYGDVADTLAKILGKWLEYGEKLRPIRSLYFSALYGKETYVDLDFLGLTQAVEVFHRRFRSGTYLHPETYERSVYPTLKDVALPQFPNESRHAIGEKLRFLNEYSLSQRLRSLVAEHSDVISVFIPEIEHVIRDIVNARNYRTHFSEGDRSKEFSAPKLAYYADTLRLILELSLLAEAGVPKEVLHHGARESGTYRWLFNPTRRWHD